LPVIAVPTVTPIETPGSSLVKRVLVLGVLTGRGEASNTRLLSCRRGRVALGRRAGIG